MNIEYRELLKHSKTRRMSLFPCVNRILQTFPALKSYLLSLDSCHILLKQFFESVISEALLYFIRFRIYIFQEKRKEVEKQKNLKDMLTQRSENNFLPLKVKAILQNNLNSQCCKNQIINYYET